MRITLGRAIAAILLLAGLPAMAQPVTAVLRLKSRVPIEQLAWNVIQEKGHATVHYYTPNDIRQIAGPSDAAYQNLLLQLRQDGFTIVHQSPTHLYVTIRGESYLFNRVFGSQIEMVTQSVHENLRPATIPSQLGLVSSISGLNNAPKFHPMFVRLSHMHAKPMGIAPATIKTAYGFDPIYKAGITGAGQDIAIATYDGFKISDVQHFYQKLNLQPGPTVDEVQFNGAPTYDENSAMETQLDAEFSGMMAPGAKIHVFASADNSDAGELAMFTAILDDNRAKVVNYSWGSCETQLTSQHKADMEKVFARAIAQGVNIMVASGDSGSDGCQDGGTEADWPGANPDIVAVGGTSFAVDSNNNIAETAWNGSGGGISALFALPSYQSQLGAPYVRRSYPDVAFNADPNTGEDIYAHSGGTPGWITIGGTSMAAPQWSGFMALVGQARAEQKKAPLGFLNPYIYGLSSTARAADFHDVTSGSNGAYNAGPGWDAVTGWGSMNANNLLQTLVND